MGEKQVALTLAARYAVVAASTTGRWITADEPRKPAKRALGKAPPDGANRATAVNGQQF